MVERPYINKKPRYIKGRPHVSISQIRRAAKRNVRKSWWFWSNRWSLNKRQNNILHVRWDLMIYVISYKQIVCRTSGTTHIPNGPAEVEKSAHNQNSGGNDIGANFILLWVPVLNQLKEGRQHVLYMQSNMKDTEGVNYLIILEGKKEDP